MAEPTDMIVPLLREMREDIGKRFDRVDGRLEAIDRKLASLEGQQTSFKQALTADSLLSKQVTGEFEQRIDFLERKLKELEVVK